MLRPSTLGGPSQPSCLREGSAGGRGETGCDKNNISSGFLLFSIFFPSAGMRVLWMGGRREERLKRKRGGEMDRNSGAAAEEEEEKRFFHLF